MSNKGRIIKTRSLAPDFLIGNSFDWAPRLKPSVSLPPPDPQPERKKKSFAAQSKLFPLEAPSRNYFVNFLLLLRSLCQLDERFCCRECRVIKM